jgi:hypothetical protein
MNGETLDNIHLVQCSLLCFLCCLLFNMNSSSFSVLSVSLW